MGRKGTPRWRAGDGAELKLTHGSGGLSSMPFPLRVRTPSAHPAQGAPIRRRSLPPHGSLLPGAFHSPPHGTSATFRLRPQSQPPSARSLPSAPGPSTPHTVPAVHPEFATPRSRPRRPLRLCATSFLSPRPRPLVPHTSSHTPPPARAPSPNGSSRHPLRGQLTCGATPVPALVRLLQLEGDRGPERLQPSPGGAGGGRGRAAPPESS